MVRYLQILPILLIVFCNEDPAGEDILDYYRDLGLLKIDTLFPVAIENSYSDLPNGYGDNVVVGLDSDYEARGLLKFLIPDTGYANIDSIKLILNVNDDLKNQTVNFEIRLVTTEWDEREARWLAASEGLKWETPGGDFGDSIIYSGSVDEDSLIISIDPALFEEIRASYGFIILPTGGGPLALEAGNSRLYVVADGGTTIFLLSGDSFIVNCFRLPDPGEYFLGSGYTFRNYVDFSIDTSYQDLWLAKAELSLGVVEHRSMRDSIYFSFRSLKEEFSGIKTELKDYQDKYLPIADSTTGFDVGPIVNYWIENPDSNYGAFMAVYPEDGDITRLSIDPGSIRLILYLVNRAEGRF